MKKNSGEVLTLILVGLALGGVATIIRANSWAQDRANTLGAPVSVGLFFAEKPVEAIAYPLVGAAAGWGIGELVDQNNNDDSTSQPRPITVVSGRDSTVVISGRDGSASNEQRQPTTTTTSAQE